MTNIYEKMQNARICLQEKKLRKSGHNKFANFDYYELGDIVPHINAIFLEKKLFSKVSFTKEVATLTIINIDKPEEQIEFTSPMADATSGKDNIQGIGSVETYQRRYLYIAALEIAEHDELDALLGNPKVAAESSVARNKQQATPTVSTDAQQSKGQSPSAESRPPQKTASEKQITLLENKLSQLAKKNNKSVDELKRAMGLQDLKILTSKQASTYIDKLVQLEKGAGDV